MLRRNREINIFSMSALDLFASALGAFMLIALIALPYYLKTQDSLMAQVRQAQEQLEQCREDLNRTFLVVVTKWTTLGHDIDLHVVDPQGNEFYFERHNRNRRHFPQSQGELSIDMIHGPGIEIWEIPHAAPGDYRIYYKFYSRPPGSVATAPVNSSIYHREGSLPIPQVSMSRVGEKRLVATVTVSPTGEVRMR